MEWTLHRNKHAWAFYYYCKKQGDNPQIVQLNEVSMTFKIDGDSRAGGQGGGERPEDGTYPGRFVQIVDVGEHEQTDFQTGEGTGKFARELFFAYELPTERIEVNGEDKPKWISERLKFSLNEKSKLTARLSALAGKKPAKTIEDLLGNPCMVEIGSTKNGNAKITNVSKLMKGVSVGDLENDARAFDMDEPDMDIWDTLPDFIKKMIKDARNFPNSAIEQKLIERGEDVEQEEKEEAEPEPDFDDDVPFDED